METISSQKLKLAMIAACIGVSQLAQKANVQSATVSKFLKTDSPVRLTTLSKLSRALNVSADDLILKE